MNNIIKTGRLNFEEDQPVRLDLFLAQNFSDLSRSQIQLSIEQGLVKVNGVVQKSKYKLKSGDIIDYRIVDREIDISDIPPQDIPLNIIFENEDVIVINKQAGISSHPTPDQKTGTLVNALLYQFGEIKEAVYDSTNKKSRIRAGIVHRLDKDTTGVMIIAKNSTALRSLSLQMKHRSVDKYYLGLCYGFPDKGKGELTNFLGRDPAYRKRFTEVGESKGKKAITKFEILKRFVTDENDPVSLIQFKILTGRTHQIRAQMLLHGYPVLGDAIYHNFKSNEISHQMRIGRQLLHSYRLRITLPHQNIPSIFEAPVPFDFEEILNVLHPIG